MAGIINVTVALNGMRTMVKEVPVCPDLQPATNKSLGYISAATISFAKSAAATPVYSIDDSGSGFGAAGFSACEGEMILVSSSGGTNSGVNDGLYTLVSDENAQLVVTEAVTTQTAAAAGTVVIYGVAVYKITPTKGMEHGLIIYSEGVESAGILGMIPCVLNGDFWAANAGLYTAFAATLVTDTTSYLWIETAKFLQSDGTIKFMLKPVATLQLYTNHRPAVGYIELP